MSLVHDALRKAAREKQRQSGGAAIPRPTSDTDALPKAEAELPAATGRGSAASPSPAAATAQPRTVRTGDALPAPEASVAAPSKLLPLLLAATITCVAVVGIVAIVYLVSRAGATRPEPRPSATTAEAPVKPPAPPPVVTRPEAPVTASASQPSDQGPAPAVALPDTVVAPSDTSYKLTGIMRDPDGRYSAVLNGRTVYEQHLVDGATVKRIERDRVTLVVGGKEQVLRLF